MYQELAVKLQIVVLKEMAKPECGFVGMDMLEFGSVEEGNVIHAYWTNNGKVRTDPISKDS